MFSIRTHVVPIHQENAMHSILLHFVVKTAEKFSLCSGQYISICFLLLANNILFLCWWATIVGKKCDPRNPVPRFFGTNSEKYSGSQRQDHFFPTMRGTCWRGGGSRGQYIRLRTPSPPLPCSNLPCCSYQFTWEYAIPRPPLSQKVRMAISREPREVSLIRWCQNRWIHFFEKN